MTKKNWALIFVALVLAVVYVVYFTDWFRPKVIVIHSASRETRNERRPGARAPLVVPVTFGFEKDWKLTGLEVVELSAWQTNHDIAPLWHLTTSSNSIPIKMFRYGQWIRGMKPAVAGTRAEELQPGVTYRLFVTAGSAHGQHDFTPIAP